MAGAPASILAAGFPPGAFRPLRDRWGRFPELFAKLARSRPRILAVADRRVLELHPQVAEAMASRAEVVRLSAGEAVKTLDSVGRILRAGVALPRTGALLAIGGGTIGDVATVAAHLLKRGVQLIQVPTTLLAAVDSSVGGKGAVDLEGPPHPVKNAAGVFHYPSESWVCGELFASLSARKRFEGQVEAYKMAVCLDAAAWARYRQRPPTLERLVRDARRLKAAVCASDPYDGFQRAGVRGAGDSGTEAGATGTGAGATGTGGTHRALLNFGHTFGHAFESLSAFALSHGEAVCLGILCALDVGRAKRATSPGTAAETEEAFDALWSQSHGEAPRRTLARVLARATSGEAAGLLAADKKADAQGGLRMVLLRRPGKAALLPLEAAIWQKLWRRAWREGQRPA